MHQCPRCGGRGVVPQGSSYISCPECLTPEKFLKAIEKAIRECKHEQKKDKLAALEAVQSFLPEYPVMALLEAEAHNLNPKFVSMMQHSFAVRTFADRKYLAEALTVQDAGDKIEQTNDGYDQDSKKT